MTHSIAIQGDIPSGLWGALQAHGFTGANTTAAETLLITTPHSDPGLTAKNLAAFAAATTLPCLAVLLIPCPSTSLADWPAAAAVASLRALVCSAALAYAPRDVRINAISLGTSFPTGTAPQHPAPDTLAVSPADVAGTVALMLKLRSMTGQIIHLSPPTQTSPA